MIDHVTETDLEVFAKDVDSGLSSKPKYLSSKYFYDSKGDELFREIMNLPEYYLTRSEYEIFFSNKAKILEHCRDNGHEFDLIELGAGDGFKTKILLKHFSETDVNFKYIPVDISKNVLNILKVDLLESFPDLSCLPLQGEYFSAMEELNQIDSNNKTVLFLGSNIGNFGFEKANEFLGHLSDLLTAGDKLIIGFDLKKDPLLIRRAYDDASGVTRAFNLNLLTRINRELHADFDATAFRHTATYNPETGEAKSFLISLKKQMVHIGKLNKSFQFDQWESIFMEVSQKYDLETINILAESNGYKIAENLFDCKHYFVDSIWEKV